jgi:hypothetical protein
MPCKDTAGAVRVTIPAMPGGESHQRRLENLRRWRNRPERNVSLAGLAEQVHKNIVKPHQQLGALVEAWRELIPPGLLERTALVSLTRGVLTVHVADHASSYELDRLLRGGVEQRLRQASKASLRKVKCRVAAI